MSRLFLIGTLRTVPTCWKRCRRGLTRWMMCCMCSACWLADLLAVWLAPLYVLVRGLSCSLQDMTSVARNIATRQLHDAQMEKRLATIRVVRGMIRQEDDKDERVRQTAQSVGHNGTASKWSNARSVRCAMERSTGTGSGAKKLLLLLLLLLPSSTPHATLFHPPRGQPQVR
ncbi:hypothetical protein IWZ03DRAFT_41993 [Phyllosticta citriasiana]|uniref:Uncharacterized protein n=1 Tax=Phyllosticta citriasiana TaxID=595635 RepID=A0ABR1KDS6_9PEZI